MIITIHDNSIEIGKQQWIEGVPYGLVDKLKDTLIDHGGQNFHGTFRRHGNISGKLMSDIMQTILKYFEHQKEMENNWQREKTSDEYRIECRDYLMSVDADKITVQDALEALGYGRNGLAL